MGVPSAVHVHLNFIMTFFCTSSSGQSIRFVILQGMLSMPGVEIAGDCWIGMPRKPYYTIQR
jgi:hypothetical protein